MKISLDIDSWCDLFAEQAEFSPHVFWVVTLDYKEQVFLSPAFEKTWGRSEQVLYQDLDVFSDFIISDNQATFDANCLKRHNDQNAGAVVYQLDNGKYIRDRFMTLFDQSGQPFAAAGIAMDVSDKMDLIKDQKMLKHVQGEQQEICNNYSNKLKDKLRVIIDKQQEPKPHITKKEKLCAYYLTQGMTAKQTGEVLFISRRTVEKHIESLKVKLNCPRKIDLMRLLIEKDYIDFIQKE